jgi:hypothetical protein
MDKEGCRTEPVAMAKDIRVTSQAQCDLKNGRKGLCNRLGLTDEEFAKDLS